MKTILKVSMVVSLMIFGGTVAQANMSSAKVQKQGEFSHILEAKDLVQVASKLEKSKQNKALSLLKQAKKALSEAPASAESRELHKEISAIEQAIKTQKNTDQMYAKTIVKFDAYINKVKQWGYEIRAHDEEAADREKFKEESKANAF